MATLNTTITIGTSGDIKGYKSQLSTVGGFGSITNDKLGTDTVFLFEARLNVGNKQVQLNFDQPNSKIENIEVTSPAGTYVLNLYSPVDYPTAYVLTSDTFYDEIHALSDGDTLDLVIKVLISQSSQDFVDGKTDRYGNDTTGTKYEDTVQNPPAKSVQAAFFDEGAIDPYERSHAS